MKNRQVFSKTHKNIISIEKHGGRKIMGKFLLQDVNVSDLSELDKLKLSVLLNVQMIDDIEKLELLRKLSRKFLKECSTPSSFGS